MTVNEQLRFDVHDVLVSDLRAVIVRFQLLEDSGAAPSEPCLPSQAVEWREGP